MNNIGVVFYQRDEENGDLFAVWQHSDYGSGTGVAKAIKTAKYEGNYQVNYYNVKGELVAELELRIDKSKDIFLLSWSKNNIKKAEGIGFETDHGLCVGYHDL